MEPDDVPDDFCYACNGTGEGDRDCTRCPHCRDGRYCVDDGPEFANPDDGPDYDDR